MALTVKEIIDETIIWKDLEYILSSDIFIKSDNCECRHLNKQYNQKEGNEVCLDCGEVMSNKIFETCEWNNYKSDEGMYSVSMQRGDLYASNNPYDKSGSVPGFSKNSLAMRLHLQSIFSHKQKTFWKISEKFQHYCGLLSIHQSVLPTANDMWYFCMESGKLTRASVRNGLISACLYYACIYNNIPCDRQKLIDATDGNQKGFLKGEKIYMQIMQEHKLYSNLGKQKIDVKENDTFVKFCNILELPFKTVHICNELYTKNLDKLDSVTPKSITAGVLLYVIKNILNLKQPSKTKISSVVNVCIPTINKVVSILEKESE
jgi:transcription initiation factor TFIIIB Brf1 subunit/transcription initiation factor TFIIB